MSGTYADLEVWQAAVDLVVRIYKLTNFFPKNETYGLTSQLRRAGVSVPSNIAEGKGRASDRELTQFLCHARASLFEIQTQIQIASRLGDVSENENQTLQQETVSVCQMLNGLIRSVRPAA